VLLFSSAVPFGRAILRDFLQRLDQNAAEAIAAVEIHADELETDFIDAGTAEENLAADSFHAQRNFDVGFGADAEIVIARPHPAAETHLTHDDVRLSPGTGKGGGERARQDNAFVAALADPGTSRTGIKRSDGEFAGFKAAFDKSLGTVAGIDLRERLNGCDSQFAVLAITEKFLVVNDGAQNRDGLALAQTAERLDGLQLYERWTILSFAGGGQRDQAGTGALVLAHADLVNGLGQDVGVEQFEQFEQGASAVGRGAVGDLANDDVLIETVELAHACVQHLQQRAHREAAQQADR